MIRNKNLFRLFLALGAVSTALFFKKVSATDLDTTCNVSRCESSF